MIRCSKCGYIGSYVSPECPACKENFDLTPYEIEEKIEEIKKAEEAREYELMAECHHILADFGRLESQKEYAGMLERGDIVARDLDKAMEYYYMAAERNDGYSAFRYSRLAERASEKAASFWLTYSAALGCVEAYPHLAEKLSREGDDETANFYFALAAAYDDTDSIVTLAKRYYNGIGTEQSLPYAKWYMDKLFLPPIHAIKMAYKLRSVKAEDPGIPKHPDLDKMLRRLAIKAQDYGYKSAYHNLCLMLSDRGDMQARMILGILYAEGMGCTANIGKALELLESSAEGGNAEAYKHMGDMYLVGELVMQDARKALEYYRAAANLGMTNAYEAMGDIFYEGKLVSRNVAKAIALYDMGAKEGHSTAAKKSETLKTRREELYERGVSTIDENPDEAFRCFAIASSMGYVPAYKYMARCFKDGLGIKKNRNQAFLWYEKATEAKDTDALYEYGLCYARGIGVAFDFDKAVSILAKAARHGSTEAETELKRLMTNKRRHMIDAVYSKAMRLIHMKKFKDAEELLRICLKFNHGKGIYTLGCLNEFGLGIPTNREMAFRLYETSFDLKFRDPRAVYKLRILKMARAYK